MKHTEDELSNEKLRHEIKNLKRWWIQPALSLIGLLILFATAVNTNITELIKVKSIEAKELQANKRLDSVKVLLHFKIDSLTKLYRIMNEGNRITAAYKSRIKIAMDTIKNKDVLIHYLKNQLDVLIQHRILNKELQGSYSNDFDNSFENGNVITTDDGNIITTDNGQPILLHENGKPQLSEDGKPLLNENTKQSPKK